MFVQRRLIEIGQRHGKQKQPSKKKPKAKSGNASKKKGSQK